MRDKYNSRNDTSDAFAYAIQSARYKREELRRQRISFYRFLFILFFVVLGLLILPYTLADWGN